MNVTVLGDICPDWGFPRSDRERTYVFEGIRAAIEGSDVCVANFEAPVTTCKKKLKKNSVCLKGESGDISILGSAGIRAISLANNHILDYGEQGLRDTLEEAKRVAISAYGAGNKEQAALPYFVELEGKKIGFLAFAEQEFNCAEDYRIGANRWDDLDSPDVIRDTKRQCDWLVVQYHGGIERYIYPSPLLQKKCRKMAECGADFVVCQHSHCIGTREKWAGSEILYGQGNCIFGYAPGRPMWNRGLVVQLTLNDTMEVKYIPIEATPEGECLCSIKDAERILSEMDKNSEQISNPEFIERSWVSFCKKQKNMYLPMLFCWGRILNKLNRITNGFLVRTFTRSGSRRTVMNLLRCDAHREVLTTIFESEFHE